MRRRRRATVRLVKRPFSWAFTRSINLYIDLSDALGIFVFTKVTSFFIFLHALKYFQSARPFVLGFLTRARYFLACACGEKTARKRKSLKLVYNTGSRASSEPLILQ